MALAEPRVIGSLFGGTWNIHRGDTAASGDLLRQDTPAFLFMQLKASPGKAACSQTLWHRRSASVGVQRCHGDFRLSFGHGDAQSPDSKGSS